MSKYRNEQNFFITQTLNLPLDQKTYIKNLFPCYLGVLFIGKVSTSILEKLKFQIDLVFDSFFFDTRYIGEMKFDTKLYGIPSKEEFNLLNSTLAKVNLYPTNTFYSVIKTQMSEKKLAIGLGLTNLPIYSSNDEELLFLFGEANLKHNCAIVSTHNLLDYNKREIIENRIIKEAIHEIGHLILGLKHCFNDNCVTKFSANTGEIDRKSNYLCEKCKSELENIRTINNF